MPTKRTYGWRPDLPDHRDRAYSAHRPDGMAPVVLPPKVDLRLKTPTLEVYDQGALGACTGNGLGGCIAFLRYADPKLPDWNPSRLFIYYNERALEGTIKQDAGAQIRDGIKVLASQGAPSEDLWPYVIKKFASKPPLKAYTEAAKHKPLSYYRVDWSKLDEIKTCLAAGFPICFGFTVYDAFESEEVAKSGILPMPGKDERALGGHCVDLWGYDDATQMGLVRNSWGKAWGQGGYFWMPYAYLTSPDLSDDFWSIRATN